MSNFSAPALPSPLWIWGLEGTGRPVSHMRGWAYPCSPQAEDGGRISHLIALIALLGVVLLALVESASGYRFATGE